jgi:hypothetical protein
MSEPSFLPFPADLDQAEELFGNLDPLGTLTHAERIAKALLPCFTVRTWRGEAVSELMPWLSADAGKSKQMGAAPILPFYIDTNGYRPKRLFLKMASFETQYQGSQNIICGCSKIATHTDG